MLQSLPEYRRGLYSVAMTTQDGVNPLFHEGASKMKSLNEMYCGKNVSRNSV